MSAKAARCAALVLVLMLVLVPAASAATKTKTVKGEVVFTQGQRVGDPGDCSAIVFVKWADVPGTIQAKAIYTSKGSARALSLKAPFNDEWKFVAEYKVQAGYHWIAVGRSWANGPVANTCEDKSAKHKELFGTEASVELTIGVDAAVCNSAKAKLAARTKTLNRLKAQLRKATTEKAKKTLRSKIAKAKTARTKALERRRAVC